MNATKIWRIIDLINWGTEHFNNKNITNARKEIEWFLCDILQCERIDLYLKFENPLEPNELLKLKKMIKRRLLGEPFQHILGKAPFYGRDFKINKNVLIPRPETELIIDILKKYGKVSNLLDLGTGSGCIAITCALENLSETIYAIDISTSAIAIAKENIINYKIKNIKLFIHNFFDKKFDKKFDVIVSNPPYITINDLKNLQPEVKNFDPHIAITDGKDGLSFYRKFAKIFFEIVKPNGALILEIGGDDYKNDINTIFTDANLQTTFYKDLQNDTRIVKVQA